jgi:hypothetical protein
MLYAIALREKPTLLQRDLVLLGWRRFVNLQSSFWRLQLRHVLRDAAADFIEVELLACPQRLLQVAPDLQ